MKFELDKFLIDDIIFCMEDQAGEYLLDTREGQVVNLENYEDQYEDEPDFSDKDRFIPLLQWRSADGYRLMEKFGASLKNPVVRQELSNALNKSKGVFRAFKNVLEQYPQAEKLWFSFKEREMKNDVIAWYNSLREEWGLEPVGSESEDNTPLVFEDFILREGNIGDRDNAANLHELCEKERSAASAGYAPSVYEKENPFTFPGDLSYVAESASSDFAGYICAVNESSHLKICLLEVTPEFRGMGLGKSLLSKLLENALGENNTITLDVPAEADFFSRTLHLEGFKPCVKKFVLVKE